MAQAVFNNGECLADLPGFMDVGHVRVGISSTSLSCANVSGFSVLPQGAPLMQRPKPFYVNAPGIAFSHNGNLINAPYLRHFLDD